MLMTCLSFEEFWDHNVDIYNVCSLSTRAEPAVPASHTQDVVEWPQWSGIQGATIG